MSGEMLARDAVVEQLSLDGVRHVFGNPGTVEQGLLDSLEAAGPGGPQYVLTLHETAAVGMADGYARATRRPTVVQLHTGVGLGNGIGMLYQAKRGHSPLVVLAGDAGLRYDAMDAQMAADLVAMAEPVTKWATRVVDPDSVLRVLRRAMKVAATPPMGPVFVALPMDVLDAVTTERPVPTSFLDTRVSPRWEAAYHAARTLVGAERPMIIAGDGVTAADAQPELAAVAEALGAEVWGADWAEVNLDPAHPLFRGQLGHMFGSHSAPITRRADAVLICGTYVFPEVFPALSDVFAEGTPVVHIDPDTWEIAKNFPVDVGIAADLKPGLGMLAEALADAQTDEQRVAARRRARAIAELNAREHADAVTADTAVRDEVPLHAFRFAEELARRAPADTVYFDEALTSSPELFRYLVPRGPGHYFQTRGGSLGVGIPGAVGLKLANPDRTVIGFVGDGGAMYTAEALWTAARYDIAAKLVICNNHSYELLKLNIGQYWAERGIPEHAFPTSFDLGHPRIDFVRLSESLGVPATRVERPEEIGPAIDRALAHDGPFLIDLVVAGKVDQP
ncbi:thiamine pyrophosphate-binding protein [Actinosynnema sp. CS-041913]|uniref:thiamine pyrophosphate-binding protein n=1 Tax=Actinosynnema sp. CS-041913 TaxID=3239917 RepID=UPI003D93B0B3